MDKQKLNTYLGSLNVPEPPPPTLESLRHLQAAHLARYAFQSLSTVLGEPVSLAEDDIFRKTVQENWGGYCYELNLLFAALLQSLGFVVRPLTGSIVHDNRPDMPHARTHMMLEVKAAGGTPDLAPAQQALDNDDRRSGIVVEQRPEHRARIDD